MTTQILCIVILLTLLQWEQQDIMMSKQLKKYSMCSIAMTIIVVLAEIGSLLVDNTVPQYRIASILFNMIIYSVAPFIFLVESQYYALNFTKKNHWVYIPAVLNMVLVLSSQYSKLIFYVNSNCEYNRGQLFLSYVLVLGFSVVITVFRKLYSIRNYPRYFKWRIVSSTGFMVIGLFIQILFPQYKVSWLVVSIYIVLFYALSCETSSMVDGLTGLLNRTSFNKMISNMVLKRKKDYYMIMLDVNDFKQINDTKGHPYGDFCLKEIANLLLEVFSTGAYVFRFGGDEFAVVLIAVDSTDVKKYFVEIKQKIVEKQSQHEMFPEIAVGMEVFRAGTPYRETINQADEQMYKNKKQMKKDKNQNSTFQR